MIVNCSVLSMQICLMKFFKNHPPEHAAANALLKFGRQNKCCTINFIAIVALSILFGMKNCINFGQPSRIMK